MKKTIFYSFFLFFLVTTACKNTTKYDTLALHWPVFGDIYALKDAYPDSALHLFQSVADTLDVEALGRHSRYQLAEYQILDAEIRYKNYKLNESDDHVMEAFRFYDSLMPGRNYSRRNQVLSFQKARAYYFKAVVEELKLKQPIEAFKDYLNALWIMEGMKGEHSVFVRGKFNPEYEHFTALVYDRLAWFLYNYDAWDSSLECLEKSSECFKSEGNAKGVASNLELMGDVILAQGDKVNSMYYFKKSDSIYERLKTDNVFLYQNYSSVVHRALDLYNANEMAASSALLHHALEEAQSDWMKRQIRFALGYFYLEEREYDSALYNYEHSFPLLPRQTLKSYCRIVQISNILGDTTKAGYYGELLANAYLIQFARSSDRAKMDLMYEEYKAECKDSRHMDTLLFVLSCIFMLLVILFFVVFIFVRRKRRHQREIEARERIQATLEDEIETVKSASQQKEETIKELQSKLDKMISNPDFQELPFDKKLEALYETPICQRVFRVRDANVKAFSSYPELVLSENHKTMLVNAVDAVFPKFSIDIIQKFPRLKRSDVVYCCLYILGVTEVQAAALTGKTYQAVWTRSLKMHEIFDNKSSLQLILHGFLKDWHSMK